MLQSKPLGFTVMEMKDPIKTKALYVKWAKDWLRDLASDSQEQEDIDDFLDNSPDDAILTKVDQLWDGGLPDFLRTCRKDEEAGCK